MVPYCAPGKVWKCEARERTAFSPLLDGFAFFVPRSSLVFGSLVYTMKLCQPSSVRRSTRVVCFDYHSQLSAPSWAKNSWLIIADRTGHSQPICVGCVVYGYARLNYVHASEGEDGKITLNNSRLCRAGQRMRRVGCENSLENFLSHSSPSRQRRGGCLG